MKKMILVLLCLSTTGLAAQTRINGGIQAGLNAPTGDFADKRDGNGDYMGVHDGLGVHFGGHLDFNFNPHSQLRLHLTVNGFAGKEQDIYTGGIYDGTRQNGFSVTQIGGDYVHNFTSPILGGYFLAGASLNGVKATYKFSNYPDPDASQSGKLGIRIGGGYTFNRRFSLEGHIDHVGVDKSGPDGFGFDALTWVTVSAVFRFGR
ncbi:MAG: outer membrane beta-barrel protein [Acidobacteria bacterium]|nr:outer membrane beta-barrel protein [Acidobacteriota bacterium]